MSEAVLVLDGAQRSALAVVRSLGRAGIDVHVGEAEPSNLAGRSRHCAGQVQLPSPAMRPTGLLPRCLPQRNESVPGWLFQ